MTPKVATFVSIACCAFIFPWCNEGPERIIQPIAAPVPSIDSLKISIADCSLYQQGVFNLGPCISSGWTVDMHLIIQNHNTFGILDNIKIWSAAVILNTTSFTIDFNWNSAKWTGNIAAGEADTVEFFGQTSRNCIDSNHSKDTALVHVLWNQIPSQRLSFVADSVAVQFVPSAF